MSGSSTAIVDAPDPTRRLPRPALLALVVLVSVGVRVIHLVNVYRTPSFSYHRTWTGCDMNLFETWASRIVAGDVLGRTPYTLPRDLLAKAIPGGKWEQWFGTAPAFYKAPLYPYLIALLRWAFGDAMLPMAILQIATAAVSAVLLFAITEHLFDRAAALLAALFFALYAPAIHFDVVMLRGPWIVLASLLTTWQLIRLQRRPTPGAAAALGSIVGLALVLNEGCVTLPVLTLVVIGGIVRDARKFLVLSGTFALGFILALAPVIARNLIVGIAPFQLAVTGAYGLAMMNTGDAQPVFFTQPSASFLPVMEASEGKLLHLIWPCLKSFGGVGSFLGLYLRRIAGLVVPFENPDNANFYYAALRSPILRALPTYALLFPLGAVGMALARRRWGKLGPLLPASLASLISIMVTLPLSRYRLTLVAFLFPFAGFALAQAFRWACVRRFGALAAAGVLILLISSAARFLERDIVFKDREPTLVIYRPVEFNLASEAYASQGRLTEAVGELLQLAQLCRVPSEQAAARLRAARLQIRAGDPAAARASLQSAGELDGTDPAVLLVIGDTYWQMLGDAEKARAAYRTLAALAPRGPWADTVRTRLRKLGAAPSGQ